MTLGDFSKQAEAYGKSRPGYPEALLDLLVADAGIARRHSDGVGSNVTETQFSSTGSIEKPTVADFGAGTGIMTRMLIERGFNVSAIEPNESMRNQANVPEARWFPGTFEQSGLEPASHEWAVAAQAFHWADPLRCLPEIRRILKPKALFTVLWNNRAPIEGDFVDWTEETIRRHVPEFNEAYRHLPIDTILESTGDFRFVCRRSVGHEVSMSRLRYLDLWKGHNRLNEIAGPDRFAKLFHDVSTYLEERQCQYINVHYSCEAWSARRND